MKLIDENSLHWNAIEAHKNMFPDSPLNAVRIPIAQRPSLVTQESPLPDFEHDFMAFMSPSDRAQYDMYMRLGPGD